MLMVDDAHGFGVLGKNGGGLLEEKEIRFKVLKTFKGEELVGKRYHPLLDVPVQKELEKNPKALRVYPSIPILKERVASKVGSKKGISSRDVYEDFVTVEEGTGIVHTAPGHGKTDNEVGQHYGLPSPSPLDDECRFTSEAGLWEGEYVKEADHSIMDHLHRAGKLLFWEKVEHSYPVCWRCKNPLIFRMSNQWFLKVEPLKEKMLRANEKVNWQPSFAKERFKKWVANAEDWNFSRQRYWGIPIPIWKCASCGELRVVGSGEELRKNAVKELPDGFDLHFASEVKLKCSCNGVMTRVPHIFDVWFDSGCAPFSSLGYPFKNKESFEKYFPPSRIAESQDQIRGWFYSLMFVSVSVFGKEPYKAVSMPGWVLDEKGEKMSKSLGNVVYAEQALGEAGADACRFYYCWESNPHTTTKFNLSMIKSEVHRFLNIYWNLHNLVLSNEARPSPRKVEDEWILSRLNTVVKESLKAFQDFEFHVVGRSIHEFVVEDLSRFYVQSVRDRLEEAIPVLEECLLKVTKLLAPVCPFITEKVYQGLRARVKGLKESVHLDSLPEHGRSNPVLERSARMARGVIAACLACRDKAGVGARWPLEKLVVDAGEEVRAAVKEFEEVVLKQCNVKKVRFGAKESRLRVKPDFKALSRDFGTRTGDVALLVKENADSLARALEKGEPLPRLGGFEVKREHLKVEKVPPEGYEAVDFKQGTVYLKTTVTEELEREGFLREVTRRVQFLRKKAGLSKEERVDVFLTGFELSNKEVEELKARVGAERLLQSAKDLDFEDYFKVRGRELRVGIKRLRTPFL